MDISVALCSLAHVDNLVNEVMNMDSFENEKFYFENIPYYEFRDMRVFFDAGRTFEVVGIDKSFLDNIIVYKSNGENNKTVGCGVSVFVPQLDNSVYCKSYKHTKWNKRTNWLGHFNSVFANQG